MRRTPCLLTFVLFAVAVPSVARAGDPTAHTAAMIQAARLVANERDFKFGVGGPQRDNAPFISSWPPFKIPIGYDEEQICPYYDGSITHYLEGRRICPYAEPDDGQAVNAPDDWGCRDPNQPPELTSLNSELGPSCLDPALACNYNHFKSNSALIGPYSTAGAKTIVDNWAAEITFSIALGACRWTCSDEDWHTYYQRIANKIHYVQDETSEHHAVGNMVCTPQNWGLSFNRFSRFSAGQECDQYLRNSLGRITAAKPNVVCDEQIVDPPQAGKPVALNDNVLHKLFPLCNLGSPFSCMGLERLLRHHCRFPEVKKSIVCNGPPDDHLTSRTEFQYCEGEPYSTGSTESFFRNAAFASKPVLEQAAQDWAKVCKQPDDPCMPSQCATWCKRSTPPDSLDIVIDDAGTPVLNPICTTREQVTGYCVNDIANTDCKLHTCKCGKMQDCGGTYAPCCPGHTCHKADADECAPETGTCVPKGTFGICPGFPPDDGGDGSITLAGGGWGDPHFYTHDGLHYNLQRVGEFLFVTDGDLIIQIRTHPYLSSKVVATIAAIAANVDGDIVEIDAAGLAGHRLLVNGAPVAGVTKLAHGGSFAPTRIGWSDGTMLNVANRGDHLDIESRVSTRRQIRGFLGDRNGVATDDMRLRDGTLLTLPLSDADRSRFANSWRISEDESLFTYGAGENTMTFTDLSFPPGNVEAQASNLLPATYASASAACTSAGIVDPSVLESCILDVGTTGDPSFATAAAAIPSPTLADAAIYSMSVDPQSLKVDRIARATLTPDNTPDGVLDVTVMGPISGFVLLTTKADGTPASSGQQWDTVPAGSPMIPPQIPAPIPFPITTSKLGIEEAGMLLNKDNGSINFLSAGRHDLKIYAWDSGYFINGQSFRLYAILPNGQGIAGPTLTYSDTSTAGPLTSATVTHSVRYPTIDTPISKTLSAVVGPGVEFTAMAIQDSNLPGKNLVARDIDIGGSTIDIHYRESATELTGAFNGSVLSFAGAGLPPIRGVAIDPASTKDLAGAQVTFDATTVNVNHSGLKVSPTSRLLINLHF